MVNTHKRDPEVHPLCQEAWVCYVELINSVIETYFTYRKKEGYENYVICELNRLKRHAARPQA